MIDLPARVDIVMEPATFSRLAAAMATSKDIKHYEQTTPLSGHVSTHDADFDYTFDPQHNWLHISITALNGFFARRASLTTIQSHLNEAVADYLKSNPA